MASKLKPPTLAYLVALKQELQRTFAADDEQLVRYRQVRTRTRQTIIPDEVRLTDVEIRDSTVADEMLRVVAALSLNPPKCHVTPPNESDTQQLNSTLRETFSEAVLMEAGKRADGAHTWRDMVDATCEGGSWTKLLFTKDTWQERYGLKLRDFATDQDFDTATEDAKKAAGVPFVWSSVDTLSLYPTWSGGRCTEMLEVTRRPLHQTLRAFRLALSDSGEIVPDEVGEALDSTPAQPNNQAYSVVFLEHWDETFCTYAIEGYGPGGATDPNAPVSSGTGRLVRQFKHGYGRVPYFFAPGFTYNWQHGRKIGQGISDSKLADVEYLSFLKTLHAQTAVRDAVPPLFRSLPDSALVNDGQDDDGDSRAPTQWKIREIINGQPGETLLPIQFPQVGPQLLEQIKLTMEAIEAQSTPRVNAQVGSGLEGAGFAINQVLAEARTQQDPLAENIQATLVELTRFMWRLVREKVRERVWVYGPKPGGAQGTGWVGAGPEDLSNSVKLEWLLDPERPSAKLIERRLHTEGIAAHIESRTEAIEAEGRNPDEVRLAIELDRIRDTPWYQHKLDGYITQREGRSDLTAQAAEAEALAQAIAQHVQAGQPGQPGAPPPAMMGPGGAPPGQVPDLGALAQAPNGAGAGPQPAPLQSLGAAQPPVMQQPGALGG